MNPLLAYIPYSPCSLTHLLTSLICLPHTYIHSFIRSFVSFIHSLHSFIHSFIHSLHSFTDTPHSPLIYLPTRTVALIKCFMINLVIHFTIYLTAFDNFPLNVFAYLSSYAPSYQIKCLCTQYWLYLHC